VLRSLRGFAVLAANHRQEGANDHIKLRARSEFGEVPDYSKDDPEAINLMVFFFYHLDHEYETPMDDHRRMLLHARVFAAAVKYQVAVLKTLAAFKFNVAVARTWKHDSFAEAVEEVCLSTPEKVRDLRDIVVETIDKHSSELLAKDEIREVVRANPDLSFELLCRKSGVPGGCTAGASETTNPRECVGSRMRCQECGEQWRSRFAFCFICNTDEDVCCLDN
jgi:hypothetical protein